MCSEIGNITGCVADGVRVTVKHTLYENKETESAHLVVLHAGSNVEMEFKDIIFDGLDVFKNYKETCSDSIYC